MKFRLTPVLNIMALGAVSALAISPTSSLAFPEQTAAKAPPAPTVQTETIILMKDGRELHGQILSETKTVVVFEYADATLNVKTKLTLLTEDIAQIKRDSPLNSAPSAGPGSAADGKAGSITIAAGSGKSAGNGKMDDAPVYGVSTTNDPNAPSFYVVPIHGQIGTDVVASIYDPIIDDIKAVKPSVVIIDVYCSDTNDLMHPDGYKRPPVTNDEELDRWRKRDAGLLVPDEMRNLVQNFHDKARDIKQVVWVHDADGISGIVAMGWDKIYMDPSARLGGLVSLLQQSGARGWADPDIRAKMTAAWLGFGKAILERGGYPVALADAMLDPEATLSGAWKGREVVWSLNEDGEFVIDSSKKSTANFTAKSAEDYCISKGTAADLNDLALLLGFREYRVIEGKQQTLLDYIENWRRSYENTLQWFEDYSLQMSYANGEDAAKYVGKAKQSIERIVAAMNQYKAVETRWQRDHGIPKIYFETLIEKMKEQLQRMKSQGSGGGAGGSRGPASGGRGGAGGGRGKE